MYVIEIHIATPVTSQADMHLVNTRDGYVSGHNYAINLVSKRHGLECSYNESSVYNN
jgi:hypothetical protein